MRAGMTGTKTGGDRARELNPAFGGRSAALDGATTVVMKFVGHSAGVTGTAIR
jgi:hypothetical protein